ncbi:MULTISPECIES: hypothetical protein [Pseudomonas]|jgi:hypothetical protein|uniref:hypothetical protein n=1 Tax=Pseudomonas TaxID=286 RepID=UPI001C42F2D4|nr:MULTISPECIES: hypothetical protein [Pseudomonas]MCU1741919.1 hypothetical protein [Pseudomonas sp. 20S_6.2_Bac1]
MLKTLSAAVLGLMCGSAYAQSVDAPSLKAGDSWVYAETVETGPQGFSSKNTLMTVERVSSQTMLVSSKQDGSNQPPVESLTGLDWSRSRDINGKQQVVNRPLAFPLSEGKTWTVEYTELNPNRQHSSETIHNDYVVTGWENVEVPAGKFKALKIESEGQWSAMLVPVAVAGAQAVVTPGQVTTISNAQRVAARPASGRLYKAFWYVPEQKRFVKSVEEYYDNKGVRSQRFSEELKSSKLAG